MNIASFQLRRRERALRLALANAPTPASRQELLLLPGLTGLPTSPGA